jgi:hypothetical protein
VLAGLLTVVAVSCVGVWTGVEVGVEWWLLASIRDRRDEDRGVTLLIKSAFSGVEPSSLRIGDRVAGGFVASERMEAEVEAEVEE